MDDFGWYLLVIFLLVMFYGEPDLHDKLIASFDDPAEVQCPELEIIVEEKIVYVDKERKWD